MNIIPLKYLSVVLNGNSYTTHLPTTSTSGALGIVLNIVFGTLTGLSVIIVVVGGIQFMASGGNPEQTNKAKNTILYAVIGLAVALTAEILINFVLNKLLKI